MNTYKLRKLFALPLCVGIFAIFCAASWQNMFRSLPEQAEQEYENNNFEQALQLYQEAQTRNPDSDTLAYNLGNTLYKLGRYQDAAQQFGKILQKDSTTISPRAVYNMGNSLHKMGRETGNQEFLENALEAFKHSIISDPSDEDAKYNYELTRRLIQQQEQQQNQQQQNQQQDQSQDQNQDQNQQQQQDQQQQEQEQQQQEQQQQQQQQAEPQDQQEAQPQPKPGEMSEEEAEKLLQALMQMEKEARENNEKKQKAQSSGATGKDW